MTQKFEHHQQNGQKVLRPLTDKPRIDRIASRPVRGERKEGFGPGSEVMQIRASGMLDARGYFLALGRDRQDGVFGQVWCEGPRDAFNARAWWVVTPDRIAYLIPESALALRVTDVA